MKRKVFWLGNSGSSFIDIFDRKPMGWNHHEGCKVWVFRKFTHLLRTEAKRFFKNTGVKLPRKNSKQLIPFHIVPAKGKKTLDNSR